MYRLFLEIATSMSEKIELYSPAYWRKWKLGVQVANKQDRSEKNVNNSQAKSLDALAGAGFESGTRKNMTDLGKF